MPVPSGNYIIDLDSAQPPDSEAKKFGAGYLRFIAKVVEQSFPNIAGAVNATHTQLNALLTGPTITSTDATAAVGPTLELYRNSASPAASDLIGEVKLSGEDSAGNTETYARAYGVILDPTSTSEDGELRFDTVLAGTLANRLRVGAGIYTPNATSGDQGIDTINVGAVYVNGQRGWATIYNPATITSGSSHTFDSIPNWVKRLRMTISMFPSNDGVQFDMILRKSGTTDITSYEVSFDGVSGGVTTAGSASAQPTAPLGGSIQNDASVGGIKADVGIDLVQGSRYKRANITSVQYESGGTMAHIERAISINDTAALTGVKFTVSAGSFTTLDILIEGHP